MAVAKTKARVEAPPLGRVERKRNQRSNEILAVASEILAQRGYNETSFEAIAEKLDVTKATLYHYFDSKEALTLAALRFVTDRSIARFNAVAAEHPDPVTRLRALIIEYLTIINIDYAEGANFALRAFEWPAPIRPQVKANRELHDLPFRQAIEDGMAAGQFAVEDSSVARHCMHGAIVYSKVWVRGSKSEIKQSIEAIADGVMTLFAPKTKSRKKL
jgi:AcrR family transcriptional regulator